MIFSASRLEPASLQAKLLQHADTVASGSTFDDAFYVFHLRLIPKEFRRISLTGFRSCTSRSQYRSVSKQTTQYE
ncbi:hypothetical protein Tco_0945663 [Tanacetum coccineum]